MTRASASSVCCVRAGSYVNPATSLRRSRVRTSRSCRSCRRHRRSRESQVVRTPVGVVLEELREETGRRPDRQRIAGESHQREDAANCEDAAERAAPVIAANLWRREPQRGALQNVLRGHSLHQLCVVQRATGASLGGQEFETAARADRKLRGRVCYSRALSWIHSRDFSSSPMSHMFCRFLVFVLSLTCRPTSVSRRS
jgi:hypothetical protein